MIIRFLSSCSPAALPADIVIAWSIICVVAYVSLILYLLSVWKRIFGFCAKSTGETRYVGAARYIPMRTVWMNPRLMVERTQPSTGREEVI